MMKITISCSCKPYTVVYQCSNICRITISQTTCQKGSKQIDVILTQHNKKALTSIDNTYKHYSAAAYLQYHQFKT